MTKTPAKKTSKPKGTLAKVADCLIITFPDGTDSFYNKGEDCKDWDEVNQTGSLM